MRRIGLIVTLSLMTALVIGTGVAFTPSSGATDEFQTHDDLLAEVGERVAEFGGMYLSEDNTILYVYLTDGMEDAVKQEEVKQAIEDVLKSDLTTRRQLRIVPAQYSMSQLYGWYGQMMWEAFRNPHVVMTDLDEGQNRLEIGVETLDAVDDLEEMLDNLNIPRKAVIISERERPVLASHRLTDRAVGGVIEGGYQITAAGLSCTLGFNTVRSSEAGFVTAGHCTESNWDGGVNSTRFYQPDDSSSANLIGVEMIDPGFTPSLSSKCESGWECHWSDSAFIRLDSGASQNLGKIVKPTGLGSRTVNHNSKFRIVDETTIVGKNQIVHYVGKVNGWMNGRVVETCTPYSTEEGGTAPLPEQGERSGSLG